MEKQSNKLFKAHRYIYCLSLWNAAFIPIVTTTAVVITTKLGSATIGRTVAITAASFTIRSSGALTITAELVQKSAKTAMNFAVATALAPSDVAILSSTISGNRHHVTAVINRCNCHPDSYRHRHNFRFRHRHHHSQSINRCSHHFTLYHLSGST